MKVVSAFAYIFAIFAFLTIGSLLVIVAFHILPFESAVAQLKELYDSIWISFQAACLGVVCITVGLTFTRMVLKKRRQEEALIYRSDTGPIVVSATAIEDAVKKVLKRFHLVKGSKIKILIQSKDVEIKLRLTLWSGGRLQELLMEIQQEIRDRVRKLLGEESHLEITCDVQRIEEHESVSQDLGREVVSM